MAKKFKKPVIPTEQRVKQWKQDKAARKPKNRSSKHLRLIQNKDIFRCLSAASLKEMANNSCFGASMELQRRDRIHDKNEVRKERYLAKLAAKRGAKENS